MTDHSSSHIGFGCPRPRGCGLEGPVQLSAAPPAAAHQQIGAVAGVLALLLIGGCRAPAPTQSQPIEPLPTEPVEFDE